MKKYLLTLCSITTLLTACSLGPSPTSLPMSATLASGSSSVTVPARSMAAPAPAATMAPMSMASPPPPGTTADVTGTEILVEKTMRAVTPAPIPAGQLTAGQWSDLNNWLFWQDLAQGDWKDYLSQWQFNTQHRLPVVVKTGEKPATDAVVRLLDAEGQIKYQTHTDNQGQAWLFAHLNSLPEQAQPLPSNWQIEVSGQKQSLGNANQTGSPQVWNFNLEQAPAVANQLDVMFMVDTTGSMGDELQYLKSELSNVVNRVQQNSQVNIRMSGGYYRDQGDKYVVQAFPFTTQSTQMLSQMSLFYADGGGDFPEAVDEALEAAANQSWSSSAKARLLFLVLDAPPHEGFAYQSRLKNAILQAASKGVRIIPIASSGIDKSTESLLRIMAIATGGRYVFLTDDSGIGNSHLKPTIGPYEVEKLNDLLVNLIQDYVR